MSDSVRPGLNGPPELAEKSERSVAAQAVALPGGASVTKSAAWLLPNSGRLPTPQVGELLIKPPVPKVPAAGLGEGAGAGEGGAGLLG